MAASELRWFRLSQQGLGFRELRWFRKFRVSVHGVSALTLGQSEAYRSDV